MVIEVNATSSEIAQAVKSCDGVLLPAVRPMSIPKNMARRGIRETAPSDPIRDNTDELLLQDAYNMRKPVFGIWYGLQSLNVWRTGTLDQHLPPGVNHEAGRRVAEAHRVQVDPESKLAAILRDAGALPDSKDFVMPVNSSHHQAPETVGDGLRLVAWCPEDNVREAVEGTAPDQFVLGVQWHPERTYDSDEASQAIFPRLRAGRRGMAPATGEEAARLRVSGEEELITTRDTEKSLDP